MEKCDDNRQKLLEYIANGNTQALKHLAYYQNEQDLPLLMKYLDMTPFKLFCCQVDPMHLVKPGESPFVHYWSY
jgi:hypothetical protein